MKCELVKNKLMDYLFAELDESGKQLVENHLQQCEDCRRELQEFRSTVKVMGQWPEVQPTKDILFIAAKEGFLTRLSKSFRSTPRLPEVLKWTVRLAVAAAVLAILFFRTEIKYENGQFSFVFGGKGTTSTTSVPPELVATIDQMQQQNMYLMGQLIAASETRQKELLLTGLVELSRQIEQQRLTDIQYVGENLQRIQRTNTYNFNRTNSILEGLVRVASTSYPQR